MDTRDRRPKRSAPVPDREKRPQRRPAERQRTDHAPERKPASRPQRRRPQQTKAPAANTSQRRRPATAKRRKKPAYGRMFDRRFKVRLLTALALVVAIVLCFIVFFRVKTVSITGNEKYTQEEILAASGLEEGDALLLVNKSSVASKIIAQLPYVNQIRIGISMPDTVRVEIEELDTAYMVTADDGTYWLMNSQGRVVEEVTAKDSANYLMVSGFQIEAPEPGDTISASKKETPVQPEQTDETDQTDQTDQSGEESQTDQTEQDTASEEQTTPDDSTPKERMEVALEILSYLEESQDTAGITQVDVSSLNDIKIHYGTQYEVDFGSATDLAYKVEYMIAAVAQLDDYESGVLDLTFQEEKVARFIPWSN